MRTSSKIYEPQGDYHGNCTAQEKHFIYMVMCVYACLIQRDRKRERKKGKEISNVTGTLS